MDVSEFKRMNNIVVNSATNGWRALIYKFFHEHKDNEVSETLEFKYNQFYAIEKDKVYPIKLFRDENYRISMMRNIYNENDSLVYENDVINISQLSLEELNGFSYVILNYLHYIEK